MTLRRYFVLCGTLLTLSLAGCGGHDFGPTGKVTGKLTFEGKPMAAGHAVSFMQLEQGFLAFGFTDAEGNFVVSSWNGGAMPVGKYNVMIAPPVAAATTDATPEEQFENPELIAPKATSIFPQKYRDANTSELEFEIKEGENNFDVDLKAK